MATATRTSQGDIKLGGDLAGSNDGAAPELTATGVTPGSYAIPNLTVDAKGRISAASVSTSNEILTAVGDATTLVKGVVQIGTNIDVAVGVISVATATDVLLGVVKSADPTHISITGGDVDTGTAIPLTDETNTWTGPQRTTLSTITFASPTTTVDYALSNVYELTMTGNSTLAATNLGPGKYSIIIRQDGTGSRTLAYDSTYKFSNGSFPTLSTAPNAEDVLVCISDGTDLYCALVNGVA